MPPHRHSAFAAWQADVMRTIVDAGPLATSHLASTERHQDSLRAASQVLSWDGPGTSEVGGWPLSSLRQRGRIVLDVVAIRLRAMRLAGTKRRPWAPPASTQTP